MSGAEQDASRYAFDNAWAEGRRRLAALETAFDPGTIAHLEARGVGDGWRCLEVGGGGGSITDWLCRRVGPTGRVLATDLDTRFLERLEHRNLQVRQHDIRNDPLPAEAFDLIHVRLVLMHLEDPLGALSRLVRSLRPGGWLVAEEFDFASVVPDPAVGPAAAAFSTVMHAPRPMDPSYGRKLLGHVSAQPLEDVDGDARACLWRGGTDAVTAWRLSLEQLRPTLVDQGHVSDAELNEALALLDRPDFVAISQLMVTVWGRRARTG
jgi:SAM-dependent methyltransferase